MEARALLEPGTNERRLVRPVVVHDQVYREVGWDGLVDGVEELAELGCPISFNFLIGGWRQVTAQRVMAKRGEIESHVSASVVSNEDSMIMAVPEPLRGRETTNPPVATGDGMAAAWRRGTWIDRGVMGFSVLGFSVPVFVFAYVLIYVFAIQLDWLPVQGYVPIREGFWPWLRQLILPSIALGTIYIALIAVAAVVLLELTDLVPRSSVGGPLTLALIYILAMLAAGLHEAWSVRRSVPGWIVSIVAAVVGGFIAVGFAGMAMEALLSRLELEGSLASTRHPLLFVLSAGMMLLALLGSWIGLKIVNRFR